MIHIDPPMTRARAALVGLLGFAIAGVLFLGAALIFVGVITP